MRAMIVPVCVGLMLGSAISMANAQDHSVSTDVEPAAPRGDLQGRTGLSNSLEEHQHGIAPVHSDDELVQSPSLAAPKASKSNASQEMVSPAVSRCIVPNFGATFECNSYKN